MGARSGSRILPEVDSLEVVSYYRKRKTHTAPHVRDIQEEDPIRYVDKPTKTARYARHSASGFKREDILGSRLAEGFSSADAGPDRISSDITGTRRMDVGEEYDKNARIKSDGDLAPREQRKGPKWTNNFSSVNQTFGC